MDFLIILAYVIAYGLGAAFIYCSRLISLVFSSVYGILFSWTKPVSKTVGRWVSSVNDFLSRPLGSGRDFVLHWFGSPLLILFMVAISGYVAVHLFRSVHSAGVEDTLLELLSSTALFFIVELTQSVGTPVEFSAADILVNGANLLLVATLTDLFVASLLSDKSGLRTESLSYVTVFIYSLIFLVFTCLLGDLISSDLFADMPQQWWRITWFTLPNLPPIAYLNRYIAYLWQLIQALANTAISFGFFYLLLAAVLFVLGNAVSAVSCGVFTILTMPIFQFVFSPLLQEGTMPVYLTVSVIIFGIVLMEVLFQSEAVSEFIESTRPFVFVLNMTETLEDWVTQFDARGPISTLAILFSGFFGGPFFLFAFGGILPFRFDALSLGSPLPFFVNLLVFLACSIPCIISAVRRGHSKKTAIAYFAIWSCLVIPFLSLSYIFYVLQAYS